MFGYEYEIVKEFPHYFLDYQERMDDATRWTDRIVSTSGEWSGNIFDFYFRVYQRIAQDVKIPFKMENGERIDDTPVHGALREALANCLINADYYGTRGLVIIKSKAEITISNPGGFRIDINEAKSGGVSDPRNGALIKMFNLINIGERAGSGIPNIYSVWQTQGWQEPTITESFAPERITLTLAVGKKATEKSDRKKATEKSDRKKLTDKTQFQRDKIVDYLTIHISASRSLFADLLGVKDTRAKKILADMISDEILITDGVGRNTVYKLKEKA